MTEDGCFFIYDKQDIVEDCTIIPTHSIKKVKTWAVNQQE